MNEELTNEVLEAMAKCNLFCPLCGANEVCSKNDWKDTIQALATALLEERAKPKEDVWKYAADGITTADVYYGNHTLVSATPDHTFTRELPKTRARQIAENIVRGINDEIHSDPKYIEYVEGVLNKYAEELTNTKETN